MKNFILVAFMLFSFLVNAQTDPLNQTKPGTTLLNSSSNNSISGVNPNGNPGTILNNNSNSSAVNNTLITPNTAVTTTIIYNANTSPIVTRDNTTKPVTNSNNVVVTTTAVNPNVTANTAVETNLDKPAYPSGVESNPINNSNAPTVVKVSGNTSTGLKPISTYSPVLSNYVPEIIVTKLRNTYADKLYDITMLKKSNNQVLYIVRVQEAGGYITYHLDAEGNIIK